MELPQAELAAKASMATPGRRSSPARKAIGEGNGLSCLRAADLENRVRLYLAAGELNAGATAVIEALGPAVRGYLRSRLPEDDANDAYSSFAEDVWRGLPGFLWKCPLRAWVYRVAWHATARLMRDGYRRRRKPLEVAPEVVAPVDHASEREARREQLEKLSDELHQEERNLLALRIGRELEWQEVSAAMAAVGREISPTALRKRFERVKTKLVELADRRGLLHERRSAGNCAPLMVTRAARASV